MSPRNGRTRLFACCRMGDGGKRSEPRESISGRRRFASLPARLAAIGARVPKPLGVTAPQNRTQASNRARFDGLNSSP